MENVGMRYDLDTYPDFKLKMPDSQDRVNGHAAEEVTCLACGWNRNEYQTNLVRAVASHKGKCSAVATNVS